MCSLSLETKHRKDKKDEIVSRRRSQILAAAKHVFARYGYRCTKTDQIAVRLKAGKGTLYRYFQDKKTLFWAVYEHGMHQLGEKMRTSVEPVADPAQRFRAGVRTYLEFFDSDREMIEIVMQMRSEFKNEYRQSFLALYGDYITRIQENLRRGIELGVFEHVDVLKTAGAISDLLQGTLYSFYVRQPTGRLSDTAQALSTLVLDGVLKRDVKLTTTPGAGQHSTGETGGCDPKQWG
jgi:AcrR family transcriptional regulator